MATPTKNITYLTGIFTVAGASPLPAPPPLVVQGMIPVGVEWVSHPLRWPVYQGYPQPVAQMVVGPTPLKVVGYTALKMTVFWRTGSGRPKRGQLWPRTR